MSPTERIAQTFPDIASQGLNTSGTAAGVRSFPQPFIGVSTGVDILIQHASLTILAGVASGSVLLGTSVDVTRSFIQNRGVTVSASATSGANFLVSPHRNREDFINIVADISGEVRVRRQTGFLSPDATFYFTVVTFLGANTDSGDIRVERGSVAVNAPSTSGDMILPGPQLTAGELLRSFCFIRGIDFQNIPDVLGDPCAAGTGTACWKHPEQWHGSVRLTNSGLDTVIRYSRFTPGFGGGPNHCGRSDLIVYGTAVIFP